MILMMILILMMIIIMMMIYTWFVCKAGCWWTCRNCGL